MIAVTLKHLQIFAAVCRENSITVAADRLNMAQPAVSLAIKELESFYGVRLFERMNRRLYITKAGTELLGYAGDIISRFNDSVNSIKNSGSSSPLRVGINVTVGETLLPDVLKRYEKRYPDIPVTSVIENSGQIENLLLKNDIDLAVIDNITASSYFVTKVLPEEEMAAVCAPFYTGLRTMTLRELADGKLLLREKGSGTRETVDRVFQAAGCAAVPVMESISSAALINAAKAGLGITVLSRLSVAKELEEGSLVRITVEDTEFLRHYFIVYHRSKLVTPAIKNFIAMFAAI